jgi:hypothetical protein
MKHILPDKANNLTECTDRQHALQIYWFFIQFWSDYVNNPASLGCPVPCKQAFYEAVIEYRDFNTVSFMNPNNKKASEMFFLIPVYSTATVILYAIDKIMQLCSRCGMNFVKSPLGRKGTNQEVV